MKLRHFVTGSSIFLVGWLAATFVYHLPPQRYLKRALPPVPAAAAAPMPKETPEARKAAIQAPAALFPHSASRSDRDALR